MACDEYNASRTRGLAGGLISWPYGFMYHRRETRQGRSSVAVLLKVMFLLRSVGREPGR